MKTKMIRARVTLEVPFKLIKPILQEESPSLTLRALLTGALGDFDICITRLIISQHDLNLAKRP